MGWVQEIDQTPHRDFALLQKKKCRTIRNCIVSSDFALSIEKKTVRRIGFIDRFVALSYRSDEQSVERSFSQHKTQNEL